jgi:hypothetical protein
MRARAQCDKWMGARLTRRLPNGVRRYSPDKSGETCATGAFSLIEIMVAVTLLSVITLGLLAMFYQTQRAFRMGANQVDTLEAGRAAIQLMNYELQEVYPAHVDGVVSFEAVGVARNTMDLPGGGRRTNLLQDISVMTRRGDEWVGITYRVDHTDGTGTDRGGGTLYRSIVSTNPWTSSAQRVTVSNLFGKISQPVSVITNNPLLNFHRVADGVVHLRVRAFDEAGRLFPEGDYGNLVLGQPVAGTYHFTNSVPAYLDIEIAMLDGRGLKQFEAQTGAVPARGYLTNHIYRVQLFGHRIPLRSHRSQFELFDGTQY